VQQLSAAIDPGESKVIKVFHFRDFDFSGEVFTNIVPSRDQTLRSLPFYGFRLPD